MVLLLKHAKCELKLDIDSAEWSYVDIAVDKLAIICYL